MTFHDVRLPDDVERGAQGGPQFRTTVTTLVSGFEKRNIDWSQTRGSWDVGYGIQTKVDFTAVIDFFHARLGQAHSFRFKDWADFEMVRQSIGATDGSTAIYSIFKRYTSGGIDFDKTLTKIVTATVSAWINNISQTVVYDTAPAAEEISIALLTGIITLGATHTATSGQDIEILCEFDMPVRFGTDSLNVNLSTFDAGAVPSLPVVEVRGE